MSTTWYEWSVKCATDSNNYTILTKSSTPPTVCPQNASHTVVSGSQLIVNKLSQENPTLVDQQERRLLVSIGMFPDYMNPTFFSRGDNFTTGVRGGGDRLVISHADGAAATNTTDIRFVDPIHLIGATIRCHGANIDDSVSFELVSPATPVVASAGGNTGNCSLYAVGAGAHMIVPSAGDGTHNVDLETPANANLDGSGGNFKVLNLSPVPASDGITHRPNGYWNLNVDSGIVTPAAGDGAYNLFDFETPMVRFINSMAVFGSPFKEEVGVIHRSAQCLPHWIYRIHTTRANTHSPADPPVQYSFVMKAARIRTV